MTPDRDLHEELNEAAAKAAERVEAALRRLNEFLDKNNPPPQEEKPVAYRNGNGHHPP